MPKPALRPPQPPGAPVSPYLAAGFYDRALAQGRHRQITGGWWEETGRLQLDLLRGAGLQPGHRLLDIGAGALRLGCKAVPYLDPGHYWATDASGALMRRGWQVELADRDRLPLRQLIEDAGFALPGVPGDIDFAIAFAVFTHLPPDCLAQALASLRARCPALRGFLFTVFLPPSADRPRRGDDAVTHPDRPPRHVAAGSVGATCAAHGFVLTIRPDRLPRGQTFCLATPA